MTLLIFCLFEISLTNFWLLHNFFWISSWFFSNPSWKFWLWVPWGMAYPSGLHPPPRLQNSCSLTTMGLLNFHHTSVWAWIKKSCSCTDDCWSRVAAQLRVATLAPPPSDTRIVMQLAVVGQVPFDTRIIGRSWCQKVILQRLQHSYHHLLTSGLLCYLVNCRCCLRDLCTLTDICKLVEWFVYISKYLQLCQLPHWKLFEGLVYIDRYPFYCDIIWSPMSYFMRMNGAVLVHDINIIEIILFLQKRGLWMLIKGLQGLAKGKKGPLPQFLITSGW